jgi:hypothetical protein
MNRTARHAVFACFLFAAPLVFAQVPERTSPLPDPASLYERVRANEHRLEEIRRGYICTVKEEIEIVDRKGTRQGTAEYDLSWRGDLAVFRPVSINGIPITTKQSIDAGRKIEKHARLAEEGAYKGHEYMDIEDLLNIYTVQGPRREMYLGRSVIVMSLVPDPKFTPQTHAEQIYHELSGVIRIDEQDEQVAFIETVYDTSRHFAGGLGSVLEGSSIRFEQQQISDGVWMPSRTAINIYGRAAFEKFHKRIEDRFSRYRWFNDEPDALPPGSIKSPSEGQPFAK